MAKFLFVGPAGKFHHTLKPGDVVELSEREASKGLASGNFTYPPAAVEVPPAADVPPAAAEPVQAEPSGQPEAVAQVAEPAVVAEVLVVEDGSGAADPSGQPTAATS